MLVQYLRVVMFRTLMEVNRLIDRYLIKPRPRSPSFRVKIDAKLSKRPGSIVLYFYTPTNYQRPNSKGSTRSSAKKDYPLIVNFHGGGFTMGHAMDDARWASTLLNEVDVIFVSVGYRKGPECPQPTAVEDGVDALRWLWGHADTYGIDRARTITTGFSAGGNLSLTTPLRHYVERRAEGHDAAADDGKLLGVVAFYPSVNQTIPRNQKVESNPVSKTKGSIGPGLYKLMDDSYYGELPPSGRGSVNLSPAVQPEEILRYGLPSRVAIYTCEYDQLLVEGEDFRKQLEDVGKTVGGTMMAEVPHGFERIPGKEVEKRNFMYNDGIQEIKSML